MQFFFQKVRNVAHVWLRLKHGKVLSLWWDYTIGPLNSQWEAEKPYYRKIMKRFKNKVGVDTDLNVLNIDSDFLTSWGIDGAEFIRCIQESILEQYADSPTRGGTLLNLALGFWPGDSVGEHLRNNDQNIMFLNSYGKEKFGSWEKC